MKKIVLVVLCMLAWNSDVVSVPAKRRTLLNVPGAVYDKVKSLLSRLRDAASVHAGKYGKAAIAAAAVGTGYVGFRALADTGTDGAPAQTDGAVPVLSTDQQGSQGAAAPLPLTEKGSVAIKSAATGLKGQVESDLSAAWKRLTKDFNAEKIVTPFWKAGKATVKTGYEVGKGTAKGGYDLSVKALDILQNGNTVEKLLVVAAAVGGLYILNSVRKYYRDWSYFPVIDEIARKNEPSDIPGEFTSVRIWRLNPPIGAKTAESWDTAAAVNGYLRTFGNNARAAFDNLVNASVSNNEVPGIQDIGAFRVAVDREIDDLNDDISRLLKIYKLALIASNL